MTSKYDQAVGARYHIYNSLFLNLPFQDILRTGTLLPLLQQYCEAGFEKGQSATEILNEFFKDFAPQAGPEKQFSLLFNFIQYVERQVALFDSIEDSAFEQINDVNGKGTVSALMLRMKLEGKAEELKRRLEDFSLRVVLTAHPTQFYPGHVLGILTDLERSIREGDLTQINLLLLQLGKTGFINQTKPTPYDEAVSLCWFLENVFYTAIPEIIGSIAEGLQMDLSDWKNDQLMRIGFWPGGDRDGNPFVTSETTLQVAAKLQETILKCYCRDARLLRRRLTFRGVEKIIVEIERKIYAFAYNQKVTYRHSKELLDELLSARKILVSDHGGLFLDLLDMFILKVKLFGFHFASLDVRQDSGKHEEVWEVVLNELEKQRKSMGWNAFRALKEEEQIRHLLDLRVNPVFLSLSDPFTEEMFKTILAIGTIQGTNGELACHRFVISHSESALHIIEIFVLARMLIGKEEVLPLDIVPLFETIEDLANAPAILDALYAIPAYREHLKRRGNRQCIMLGFSDGTKDGGYLRANWSIFRAKENLTAISRKHGFTAVFFDGRGGPPARGGGNTHDFYASLGDTIENQEVQITIQGQTISSNFGKIASCKFNLEQLLSAGLEGPVFGNSQNKMKEEDKKLLDELAEAGYTAYLDLKHHPKFVPYLEKVTPLSYFGDTNIGSRPVKRGQAEALKFEDLRAIPFVGSWAMMKQNIPGFYGVGSALNELSAKGKDKALKDLYRNSLFFRTLLGNSMMSLTKTYYPATAYLGNDPEFGPFWKKMYAEYELSKEKVLDVSGLRELMQSNPSIRDSVNLRERIVLPLVTIQQYALMNLRHATDSTRPHEAEYRKLIIRCMFGIINAARNSA
ncbi:MAG TPA: phosphoenolpyruvate carboxylase [Cyclobacteriaceae bacterium]|nr:phosphoenolpyruvate carboxylase [Cyclobacteriaceae bacterium]